MIRIVMGTVLLMMASSVLPAAEQTKVERGKYLVHHVAMCIYCHTPKNEDGNLEMDSLLAGSPMPVHSPYPNQVWGFMAPNLRSLPARWGENEFVDFLRTGKTPNGYAPRNPMPPFRMTAEDAAAVAAYLNSLTSSR